MGRRLTLGLAGRSRSRHLSWEAFESRIGLGPPLLHRLKGQPRAAFFVDPGGKRVGLRVAADEVPRLSGPLADLEIVAVRVDGESWIELATSNPGLFREFYGLACVVSDRLQTSRDSLEEAIEATVGNLGRLVRSVSLMSEKQQVGLIGELLVLKRIAAVRGWAWAEEAWHGPEAEEHDFTLTKVDVEVKTTRRERRIHEISSLEQLVPKNSRPLYLVSLQVTPSVHGRGSFSLTGLIREALSSTGHASRSSRQRLLARVESLGWREEHAELYQAPYTLRNRPRAALVDSSFPALVPGTLAVLGAAKCQRIGRVSYELNVDGLGVEEGTTAFKKALAP